MNPEQQWQKIRLIVEVKIQGTKYKVKDFRWGVERALQENDPIVNFNKYRPHEHKIQRGRLRVLGYSKVLAAKAKP